MASTTFHESQELLTEETRNMHRAIVSLIEELEAIDWYRQRADACSDPQLETLLVHNKNEEIEHAVMVLEWIRRHDAHFDEMLRTYLFSEAPITDIEKGTKADGNTPAVDATLGIGGRKGR